MRHQNKNSLLKRRLDKIERLYRLGEISDKMYDILDTSARQEAGLLTYEDVYSAVVDGFIKKI